MTIENYFDKIYIINLERSLERKKDMISQMKKFNITNFIFLAATDGKTLDKNKLKENNEWAYPGNQNCKLWEISSTFFNYENKILKLKKQYKNTTNTEKRNKFKKKIKQIKQHKNKKIWDISSIFINYENKILKLREKQKNRLSIKEKNELNNKIKEIKQEVEKLIQITCNCRGKGHDLSAAQISLHLNNYYIWQDMIKNNYKKCLILEDDCVFTEYFENLENDIKFIPENWELLYLGHSKKITSSNTEEKNIKFKKLIKGVAETHIYGVSLEGARVLIEHTYPIRAAIDGYLARFMINNRVLQNIYISTTSYALNGSVYKLYKTTL